MEHRLDVRGLRCPIPLLRARAALPGVAPGDSLVVFATDPEARIDLAALAADAACAFTAAEDEPGIWRLTLRRAAPAAPPPPVRR